MQQGSGAAGPPHRAHLCLSGTACCSHHPCDRTAIQRQTPCWPEATFTRKHTTASPHKPRASTCGTYLESTQCQCRLNISFVIWEGGGVMGAQCPEVESMLQLQDLP